VVQNILMRFAFFTVDLKTPFQPADYIASDGRMMDGYERTWKEAVVALIEVLFLYLLGGTEDNRERPHSG
jgi:hypothetical protein